MPGFVQILTCRDLFQTCNTINQQVENATLGIIYSVVRQMWSPDIPERSGVLRTGSSSTHRLVVPWIPSDDRAAFLYAVECFKFAF